MDEIETHELIGTGIRGMIEIGTREMIGIGIQEMVGIEILGVTVIVTPKVIGILKLSVIVTHGVIGIVNETQEVIGIGVETKIHTVAVSLITVGR